ncbi:MAG: hypothetical protein KDA45_15890, partial [Planctomycetales bacterium]|nr:hypothetical protein [Planctomycetales bacterium]
MSLSSSVELWQRLAAEGLATPQQCRSWAAEVAEGLPSSEMTDALPVLKRLIDLGKLTPYQAKIVAGQSEGPLHREHWLLRQRLQVPTWTEWYEVKPSLAASPASREVCWGRWLEPQELPALRRAAPGLPRALKLAAVENCPRLQKVYAPERNDGALLLRVAPLAGEMLTDVLAAGPTSEQQTLAIVGGVAEALAAMHAVGIVHGRLLPDRVFVGEQGVTLAVDPLCAHTIGVDGWSGGLLGSHLGHIHPLP